MGIKWKLRLHMGTHQNSVPVQLKRNVVFLQYLRIFFYYWTQLHGFYYLFSLTMLVKSLLFIFTYAGIPYSQM